MRVIGAVAGDAAILLRDASDVRLVSSNLIVGAIAGSVVDDDTLNRSIGLAQYARDRSCYELFGSDNVRSIGDLKGKTVGVQGLGSLPHTLVTLMAAQIGLDPKKDIRFVTDPKLKPIELFIDGKIDAFLGFPPEPQELRARKIGQVLVNTATDRPWSQYFCCLLAGNRDWVQKHPVATKRALRAILKAADLCATDPPRTAQRLVDGGFTARYDYALQTLSELPYDKWREYDHEDTVRFYALRLREAGMVKASPQKIIADGADWRFLNDLKRELKV